jgi:hypothetical protein
MGETGMSLTDEDKLWIAGQMSSLRAELYNRIEKSETKLFTELYNRIEKSETTLLTEFHK